MTSFTMAGKVQPQPLASPRLHLPQVLLSNRKAWLSVYQHREQMSRVKWDFCFLKHIDFVQLWALMVGNVFGSHIAELLHFIG